MDFATIMHVVEALPSGGADTPRTAKSQPVFMGIEHILDSIGMLQEVVQTPHTAFSQLVDRRLRGCPPPPQQHNEYTVSSLHS